MAPSKEVIDLMQRHSAATSAGMEAINAKIQAETMAAMENMKKIQAELEASSEKTVDLVVERLNKRKPVDHGTANVSNDLIVKIDNWFAKIEDVIDKKIGPHPSNRGQSEKKDEKSEGVGNNKQLSNWRLFKWTDGTVHILPQDYEFPKDRFTIMIDKWFLGDIDRHISPLGSMCSSAFGRISPSCRKRFIECKQLMNEVEKVAKEKNVWVREGEEWSVALVNKLKDAIRERFVFGDKRRSLDTSFELKWRTIQRKLVKQKREEYTSCEL